MVRRGPGRNRADEDMGLLDNVFGLSETSLLLRGQRAGVLAANLANADTPNYKARDLDFAAVLGGQSGPAPLPLAATQAGHLEAAADALLAASLRYRIPYQPSLDGNTVEAPVEQATFAQNAVRYQASLMFINRRIASIESALTGQ
jgi:flagellar basal-body rod protein FlgB